MSRRASAVRGGEASHPREGGGRGGEGRGGEGRGGEGRGGEGRGGEGRGGEGRGGEGRGGEGRGGEGRGGEGRGGEGGGGGGEGRGGEGDRNGANAMSGRPGSSRSKSVKTNRRGKEALLFLMTSPASSTSPQTVIEDPSSKVVAEVVVVRRIATEFTKGKRGRGN